MWDAEAIRSGLPTKRIGHFIVALEEVGSTNDAVAKLAESGAPEGTAVVAEQQLRGRGRLGRHWESPKGVGIWTSVLLRPFIPSPQAPFLSLLAAVAAAEAIEETTSLPVQIKWPNDLFLEERKAGGILAELSVEGMSIRHLVLGIGINVNHCPDDFSVELRPSAVSLRMALGRPVPRLSLLRSLYLKLDYWYDRFLVEGSRLVLDQYRRRCLTLGKAVEVKSEDGVFLGDAVDLGPGGELLVKLPSGEVRAVFAGEATLRIERRE